ncbi:MAG TPA: helix-turn-helix domain-containing protein [Firmicutes bacterium]|nr:helix-turn-helix domain-containing protein [Bacillota bacterium]
MFNMEHTGAAISKARKVKGLTQMEFADKLNISFQAVSNCERGISMRSMPDISKLPEIAEILQISIDELLGKKAPLINGIISEGDDYLKNNQINQKEVVEAAPLLKPGQIDKAFKSNALSSKISEIENLLPFLSTETCDKLFKKAVLKMI